MSGSPLAPWQNFYVIVGSAGGALIAIQFVVITLIAATRRRASAETIHAFGTPTVVHLSMALLVSALMCAPWASLGLASGALAITALAGLGYGAVVIRRTRRQTGYRPVFEDWLWYAILPLAAYVALAVAALFLPGAERAAEFAVAASTLALLFIGIHNAWDAVTHMVAGGDPSTGE
jgi:hypothetical protein